nr:zinc finger, CW-type [Tanacetum cinerariifolium]
SDRGGEYLSQEFKDYLSKNGIVQHLTSSYTLQQNGVSKRRNRTLLDMVRSMFNLTTLPLSFWDYALESAVRILNMVPTKKGCEASVKCDSADKLHQRSVKCIFVGYPKETMGYYFYFPHENKVIVARYGNFLERDLISQKFSGRDNDSEDDHMDTLPSKNTSKIPVESESLGSSPELIPVRRSERTTRAPNRLCLNIQVKDDEVGDLGEPANYKAAMLDPNKVIWQGAMDEEMNSMKVIKVWIVVDLPPNAKVVRSKWLYKKKTDMDGKVHTYKAHLVAKGYTQTYGIDYEETFSPVADIRAIRILIAIAAYYDYEIWQMNVKTAFLNGRLDADIYMEKPEGYVDPKYPNRTGYVFVVNGGAVDRKSKKLTTIAMHSVQAEYVAASEAAMKAVWIRKFVRDTHDNVLESRKGTTFKGEPSVVPKEESLDPVSTHDDFRVEKSYKKNENVNSDEKHSGFSKKSDSDVSKGGSKIHDTELVKPLKQKAAHKATSHEKDGMKLATSSSGGKKKSKGSQSLENGTQSVEVPKVGSKNDSSSKNRINTHRSNVDDLKNNGKVRETYKDFFGELYPELEDGEDMAVEEKPFMDRLKDCNVAEKGSLESKISSKQRVIGKKGLKPSSLVYPGVGPSPTPQLVSASGNGVPVLDAAVPASLAMEDWVCCDRCEKWRLLPPGLNPGNLPEKWFCSMLDWL